MARNENSKQNNLALKYSDYIDKHKESDFVFTFKSTQPASRGGIEKFIEYNITDRSEQLVGKGKIKATRIDRDWKFINNEKIVGSFAIIFADGSEFQGDYEADGVYIRFERSFQPTTLIVRRKEDSHASRRNRARDPGPKICSIH